jgi:hypothetical protein
MHSPSVVASIDAMFNVTGLLIRAAIYGVCGGLPGHTDSGMMILAGLFVGDALASDLHRGSSPRRRCCSGPRPLA